MLKKILNWFKPKIAYKITPKGLAVEKYLEQHLDMEKALDGDLDYIEAYEDDIKRVMDNIDDEKAISFYSGFPQSREEIDYGKRLMAMKLILESIRKVQSEANGL